MPAKKTNWTKEQIDCFPALYQSKKSVKEIAILLDKRVQDLRYRADQLNIRRAKHSNRLLSEEDIDWMVANFEDYTNNQFAEKFKCDISSIRVALHARKMLRIKMEYWTEEQVQFLRDNFQTYGDKQLAILMNELWYKEKSWTFKHIEKKRLYLKLNRTAEERKAIKKKNVERGCWMGTSTWETRSQSPDGTTTMWKGLKVLHIKVNGRFVLAGRYTWEQHFGKIPEGHIVAVIDGDPNNALDIKNLICGTRAEVNHIAKEPPELKRLKHLISQINKKLQENDQQH